MQQELLSADELLGNIDSFTVVQRTARVTFIEIAARERDFCGDGQTRLV